MMIDKTGNVGGEENHRRSLEVPMSQEAKRQMTLTQEWSLVVGSVHVRCARISKSGTEH